MKGVGKNVSLVQKMRCVLTADEFARIAPVQRIGVIIVTAAETVRDIYVNVETAAGSVRMSVNVRKTVKTARDLSVIVVACATTVSVMAAGVMSVIIAANA